VLTEVTRFTKLKDFAQSKMSAVEVQFIASYIVCGIALGKTDW
jgi:hypothetical protein